MIDYIIKCLFSIVFIVISNPYTLVVVVLQLIYFYYLRKKVIVSTRDCFGLKQRLNAPVISLIQDSINGQMLLRAFKRKQFFLEQFWQSTNHMTEAFVTSNGINRYTAYRIDMQAYYLASIFAAICLFGDLPSNKQDLAVKAIGFQMAVEVARHFNTAIRWTFKMEMDLVSM